MDSLWQYPIDRIQFTLNNWNRSVWQWWPKKGKIIHSYKIIRAVRVENCVRIWNIISVIAFSTTQAHARREHNNKRLTCWVRLKECSHSLALLRTNEISLFVHPSYLHARTHISMWVVHYAQSTDTHPYIHTYTQRYSREQTKGWRLDEDKTKCKKKTARIHTHTHTQAFNVRPFSYSRNTTQLTHTYIDNENDNNERPMLKRRERTALCTHRHWNDTNLVAHFRPFTNSVSHGR